MTSSVFPKTKVFITHHVDAAFSGRSHTTKTLTKLQWIPTFFPHFQKPGFFQGLGWALEQAGLIQIQQSWKGHSQLSTCPMWMFPKIAGTPQIIHLNGTFHYKPSILGYTPIFGSTPMSLLSKSSPLSPFHLWHEILWKMHRATLLLRLGADNLGKKNAGQLFRDVQEVPAYRHPQKKNKTNKHVETTTWTFKGVPIKP